MKKNEDAKKNKTSEKKNIKLHDKLFNKDNKDAPKDKKMLDKKIVPENKNIITQQSQNQKHPKILSN